MKKLFIVLILFFVGCGYEPIYLKSDQTFLEFNKITLIGDERINKRIIGIAGLKENNLSNTQDELTLQTDFIVKETSKNSKGQIETYRSIITIQLTIKNEEKIIKSKSFLNEFSYNNKTNKFELTQFQNEIKNNLINKSSDEILLFLKLS
jgi:hypothetical protein|tara:strand:+ start:10544 stop:10993 length:450 start_codon:yes stop_codon:yes gene_type:complete